MDGIRGTCRKCGKKVPPTHGYCVPCACQVDGFDSGAHYSDDFEGTTPAAARLYFETNDYYVPTAVEMCGIFNAHLYLDGVLEGLLRAARVNAERMELDAQVEG